MYAENVANLCRVWGLILSKDTENVKDIKSDSKNYFYINVDSVVERIHPPKICFKCYLKMRTVAQRACRTKSNHNTAQDHPLEYT